MKTAKSIVIIILLAVVGYLMYRAIESSDRIQEQTIRPELRNISRNIVVPGIIMPSKEIEIKSNISGVLDELYVKVGDQVQKGQAIARIRVETNPAEYRQLQKSVEVAETQYRNSRLSYDRNRKLYEKKVIAKAEFEKEELSYRLAKAEYDAAVSELQIAGSQYHTGQKSGKGKQDEPVSPHNIVTATDDGTLLELPVRTGGPVMSRGTFSEGTTIARIARLDSLMFRGHVTENDIYGLKENTPLRLVIGAMDNYEIAGALNLIAPKGVLHDGIMKFEIEADVIMPENLPVMIRAGYSANAVITVESRSSVISIEEKYLNFSGDSVFVEIKDPAGRWKRSVIKTGISDGIYTEILSGADTSTIIKAY